MNLVDEIELPGPDPERRMAEQLNDAAMAAHKASRNATATSVAMLRRAIALTPERAAMWSNLGVVLWREGNIEGTRAALERAVALDPTSAACHGNLGVFLSATNETDRAEWHLTEAMRLDPKTLGPRWDRSLLYLRTGRWDIGLQEYDVRIAHKGPPLYPKMPAPMWDGEDLSGKTLYVQAEQGIGDRFLFSRYLAWIKETWPDCRILCCLFDGLVNPFWEFRHLVEFLPTGIPWPEDIDYCQYMCGLPRLHKSRPDFVPPDPGLLRKRILIAKEKTKVNLAQGVLPSIKVGIAWTGNPEQLRNQDRTIPLEQMLTLAEDPRVLLYSFQCSPGGEDVARLKADDLICDLGPEIEKNGWVHTGMALMEMDLVVTACTSIAHFAGALGVPTITLLCTDPYWVWGRSGAETVWYPDMRLLRQDTPGDWRPVLDRVKTALSRLADDRLS